MKILFVCLGNICRSPSAEGVFRHALERAGMQHEVSVDSCGIGPWHVGKGPDARAREAALRRGIDIGTLRARQLAPVDFDEFDYLLAMDHDNLSALQAQQPAGSKARVELFLNYADTAEKAVPDPYYGGEQGFETVLDLIEEASEGFIAHLQRGDK
ncbi:low molecular weight protein-tyrosine-phosphatase [Halomonas sp. Bachu 37]|uniref:low molecular weight protein-tyrosine-phosphatase n=1 Tax=Halomonas kashgarensis TaxID=3084920 RepID=UPI0032172F32